METKAYVECRKASHYRTGVEMLEDCFNKRNTLESRSSKNETVF